jgi:glycosyltransferase involved in cell wall biosynthesis
MKLAIITCYNQPDYIRAKTLRAASSSIGGVETLVIKNSQKGFLRYFEVLWKVLKIRIGTNPDAYLLTFRGYEILLPVRIISWRKKLIYDEYINPIEWIVKEKRQVEAKPSSPRIYRIIVALASRVIVAFVGSAAFKWLYRKLVQSVDLVLTDTKSHADISAQMTDLPRSGFLDIPVGADEALIPPRHEVIENDIFTVLYYGNMLPLHGLSHVIEAAVRMNHHPVKFILIGGNAKAAHDVAHAVGNGANIDYKAWVEFEQIPKLIEQADLCLAGPFGDTFQAQYVVTGKAYQYLAMGRPTLVGSNKESNLFADKENALVVRQADSDALVEAIRWAMEHPEELVKIGKAGKVLYENELSVAVIATRLKEMLSKLGFAEPVAGK